MCLWILQAIIHQVHGFYYPKIYTDYACRFNRTNKTVLALRIPGDSTLFHCDCGTKATPFAKKKI